MAAITLAGLCSQKKGRSQACARQREVKRFAIKFAVEVRATGLSCLNDATREAQGVSCYV